eukprot:1815136-Prymnesium_polylepis.2
MVVGRPVGRRGRGRHDYRKAVLGCPGVGSLVRTCSSSSSTRILASEPTGGGTRDQTHNSSSRQPRSEDVRYEHRGHDCGLMRD